MLIKVKFVNCYDWALFPMCLPCVELTSLHMMRSPFPLHFCILQVIKNWSQSPRNKAHPSPCCASKQWRQTLKIFLAILSIFAHWMKAWDRARFRHTFKATWSSLVPRPSPNREEKGPGFSHGRMLKFKIIMHIRKRLKPGPFSSSSSGLGTRLYMKLHGSSYTKRKRRGGFSLTWFSSSSCSGHTRR